MRRSRGLTRWGRVCTGLALLVSGLAVGSSAGASTTGASALWLEPNAGFGFVTAALNAAHRSIDLSMYELEDASIEQVLIHRAAQGVAVRVVLNTDYTGAKNDAAVAAFQGTRVRVVRAPAGQIFHAKYFVIDRQVAYVGTGNFTPQYYASSRDAWVATTNPSTVAALSGTFAADFAGAHNQLTPGAGVVWSPGSEQTLVALMGAARQSLWVENEEMKDTAIVAALARAAARHVTVHVTMTASASWTATLQSLANAGVHVVTHSGSQLYIHAKLICVDCSGAGGTLFLGSENFSTTSLLVNREVGLLLVTPSVVAAVWRAEVADATVGILVGPSRSGGGATTGSLALVTFAATVARGSSPTLAVRTRAGATCTMQVTLPSGRISTAAGLGSTTADGSGLAAWTWHVSTATGPGTATAQVRCPTGSLTRSFAIT